MSRPCIQTIFYFRCVNCAGISCSFSHIPKPLSIFDDGNTLSHDRLVDLLRHALRAVGLDTSQYSFRFGAVTAAARAGIQNLFIQNLGHWKSSVFTSYIRATLQLFQPSSQICQLDSNYVISTKSLK